MVMEKDSLEMFQPDENAPAAIFFTTGSTGAPKGVVYTHKMMQSQVLTTKTFFDIQPGEVDLPAFPLFVLFSTAFGITAVIPDMDPTKPAQVNPMRIIEAIEDHGVTNTFGSPAIWDKVSQYCIEHKKKLPSMRRILIAGAPVPGRVLKRFQEILPHGDTYTPYGATEALPITSISGKEICEETDELTRQGKGVCVGRTLPGLSIKIIKITEDPIVLDAKGLEPYLVPKGEVGEIIVEGPYVTREYFARPKDNEKSKIIEGNSFWHRMGDLGYFDEKDRLWMVGRKAHRVCRGGKLMFSVMIEAHFNQQKDVFRSALVGVPHAQLGQQAVIVIEPLPGKMVSGKAAKKWGEELLSFAKEKKLEIDAILFHPSFPVDIRHNAKIRREVLAEWAAQELGIK
jgi:acyl-CoA synthetase (AMP-forming)/AMP-acid ligase II